MLRYCSIPLVLSILLCWILWYSAISRGLICHLWYCGLCNRTLRKQTHRLLPFLTGLHAKLPFPAWSVAKPFCHHHVAQELLCAGRQLKQQATILLSLLSKTLCICTATAEERLTDASFLLANAPRTCSVRSNSWETIYCQRLACIDTGWSQTNAEILFYSTCAFHLALLDSMIFCN